jgi:uncharacterized protein
MVASDSAVTNYLIQKAGIKFKPKTLIVFGLIAVFAWTLNLFGQMGFPTQNLVPFLIRSGITGSVLVILLFTNLGLLKKSGLPTSSLGIQLSAKSLKSFLMGVIIGCAAMAIMGLLMYVFVPYHFIHGPLNNIEVFKTSFSYLLGNTTEELMFRAFPLIILSQKIGWRKAVLIMAVPFGLFHLPGVESFGQAINIVITTALYALVFGLAFVLTGSLWAAIGAHVASNIILHLILGLDGGNNAMLIPVFDAKWPSGYNLSLTLFIVNSIFISSCLYISIVRKTKRLFGQKHY